MSWLAAPVHASGTTCRLGTLALHRVVMATGGVRRRHPRFAHAAIPRVVGVGPDADRDDRHRYCRPRHIHGRATNPGKTINGAGNDTITGTDLADTINGGDGNDR